ncbi:alpha-tocopherol transfer protein-like [Bicyclus anynana]|uniref:Alpha-tocopherol transfer protein-like n=1 Tax=Bicyclus anynana TaxID=110368 RepID=A0ABM3LI76_BICAN|nr:alpha-tocopherol transfer protein-like [Bicyclus anynana]
MSPAASFGERWARDNLDRETSPEEIQTLDLFPVTCGGDLAEAAKRARRYYTARGASGLTELWHRSHPDDEDILSSCQDAYIVPLRVRSVGGRRVTLVRLPAPTALDRPLCAHALLSRWLMILDLRLREDPTPGEEVVFIDVCDLQPSHLKNHFRGSFWKDFVWCMKSVYPIRFSEVHIINTQRLKTMSLLLLHIGLYPWRRKIVHIHANGEQINNAMAVDHFPIEGLPYEYGGKAGAMKDLNDEWTKKLLLNSKWLAMENQKFYDTELKLKLKPQIKRARRKSAVRNICNTNASYDMLTRTHSCRSLYKKEDMEEGTHGAYRTLKVTDRHFHV